MKRYAAAAVFIFIFAVSYAQNNGAILMPKVVYAGDPAILVLPLPASISNSEDVILTSLSPNIPKDDNIDFHRIVLERRVTGSRLLIEFTAFVPGFLKLPVIEIGGEYFTGLSVTINSVIDTRLPLELSGHASSLAMPGTAVMLYGTMAAIVFILLLILWFIIRGRTFLKIWTEKWKRRRLFTFTKNMEKRLQKALLKGGDKRVILDKISVTFRDFLSILTDVNCHTMTAREFKNPAFNNLPAKIKPDGAFLEDFFRRCDKLRFSGEDVNAHDISTMLDDMCNYIEILYLQEKEKPREDTAA
ncbi:MAG: hypothetical protein LBI04_08325 [Treponema sp.]|jgi:hypothetical protein|nr:hypothetical protein [Treponema sp.]